MAKIPGENPSASVKAFFRKRYGTFSGKPVGSVGLQQYKSRTVYNYIYYALFSKKCQYFIVFQKFIFCPKNCVFLLFVWDLCTKTDGFVLIFLNLYDIINALCGYPQKFWRKTT